MDSWDDDARVAGENELERIQIQIQKQIQKFDNLENAKNSLGYILLIHFLVNAVAATMDLKDMYDQCKTVLHRHPI
jgi:hypothetical protein